MTDQQFSILFSEALASENREAYISDCALSSIWGDDPGSEVPDERIQQLGELWDAAHMSIQDICRSAKMTQRDLSRRFAIPYNTVSNWFREVSKCPDYTRLMLLQLTGLYQRPGERLKKSLIW